MRNPRERGCVDLQPRQLSFGDLVRWDSVSKPKDCSPKKYGSGGNREKIGRRCDDPEEDNREKAEAFRDKESMADRRKVNQVKEIVPHVREDVIEKLLAKFNNNVEVAINAALELPPSLADSNGRPPDLAVAFPTPSLSKSPSTASLGADSSAGSGTHTPSQSSKICNYRGSRMRLPDDFLHIPDFRRTRVELSDSCISFSIAYRRQNRSFGFSIQDIDSEVVIVNLDMQNVRKSLAVSSGVQVGDILVGINNDTCAIGTDTQDILELLTRSGQFVTLHFQRRFNFTGKLEMGDFHPALPFLAEQNLVSIEGIFALDKEIKQLKSQWVAWDDDLYSARIIAWQLDEVLQDYWDDLVTVQGADSRSSISPAHSSIARSPSVSSSSSSSRRQSLGAKEETSSSSMSFSRRLSRRFSASSALEAAASAGPSPSSSSSHPTGERTFDESRAMKYIRPALAVHILRIERAEKVSAFEDLDCVLWCCDVRSEVEWVIKRKIKDFCALRRRLIKAKHRITSLPFSATNKSRSANMAVIENEHLRSLQGFLRETSAMASLNPQHPSSIRIALLAQDFLAVRDSMTSITVQQLQSHDVHYRAIQVYVHNVLQLPAFRTVVDTFVTDFLANKVKDVSIEWIEETADKVIQQLKTFLDNFQSFIYSCLRGDLMEMISSLCEKGWELQGRSQALIKAVLSSTFLQQSPGVDRNLPAGAECETLIHQVEDEIEGIVRAAIRKQIETEVYIPCMGRVQYILQRVYFQQEKRLQERMAQLISLPQSYYDIPVEQISPSSWAPVVKAFRDIRNLTLPCDKIQHLLQLSKSIHALFRAEHPAAERAMGADDLFPVFIYIVVQSQSTSLWALNHELQNLCDPERAFSEAGYYLATLQACISHLLEMDIQQERPSPHT